MPLNAQGYAIINLPPLTDELKESFSDLPFDKYMGNNRYRRFSQYRISGNSDNWGFEKLPSRPYMTYSKYNKVAGGIKRFYEPITADFTPYISIGFNELGLDKNTDWQINVHQYRVLVSDELEGITVPEGIHTDGHDYIMIIVANRHNITGGAMCLYDDIEGKECFFEGVVEENQAALLNDRMMYHYVSHIGTAPGHTQGHRDIVVIAISKWSERWYGDNFEDDVKAEQIA